MARAVLITFLLVFAPGCSERSDGIREGEPAAWSSPAGESYGQFASRILSPPPAPPSQPDIDREFAIHALQLSPDIGSLNLTPAAWNGRQVIFADYSRRMLDTDEDLDITERPLVALWRTGGGGFERADVTLGEHEGGEPQVAAIGFANADTDAADELIVILTWDIRHYVVWGTAYEVRILDDAKPGESALVELTGFGDRFEFACNCDRRDEPPSRARFQTIRDVKAELDRLGF